MSQLKSLSSTSSATTDKLARAADALSNMQAQGDLAPVVTISETGSPNIPPALFGAGGPIRKGSQAPTPPPAVKGIGKKVAKPDYSESKIVVAMVGLPARGKSYLSNKLMIYLNWLEYDVKVFNVGQLRRSRARQKAQQLGIKEDHTASFFSHSNVQATQNRDSLAEDSLEMLIQWLKEGGNVGIHDATNSTKSRRAKIEARVAKEKGMILIFLESLCDDPAIIAANVALKVSQGDPDYKDMSPDTAKADFLRRISEYEKVYETITEPSLSYVRIVNVGEEVTMSRINGYLSSRIAFYLMNLHIKKRSIYLSRHGESQFNVEGKIGGDSLLSPRGMQYAKALPELVMRAIKDHTQPLTVWTSTLKRTIQTAQYLPYTKLTWKSLDELDAGVCDGMTYEEIEQEYPDDFANRDDDKFNYRYRGGESYRDVVIRLEPVIMELERQESILIVGHQAILRCLYAYFHHLPQVDLPYIKIPLHTIIKLTPKAYGCDEERFKTDIGAVDTHRPKPGTEKDIGITNSTQRKYFVEDEKAQLQVHAPQPKRDI
ncbi:fructose- -bisphosphatase [Moniliophthora roreri MCA 2997]|uniref:fructose-2,6-bisphosphate 2-phosphatase n=1 Tax=Moniliophthora roreri (strain MCA 2997) TaxID=1381753 RepID=V2XSQ1_MONRO|nr:fructose- -bisphosphatase [Moniliophthora roreri MCA 2997]